MPWWGANCPARAAACPGTVLLGRAPSHVRKGNRGTVSGTERFRAHAGHPHEAGQHAAQALRCCPLHLLIPKDPGANKGCFLASNARGPPRNFAISAGRSPAMRSDHEGKPRRCGSHSLGARQQWPGVCRQRPFAVTAIGELPHSSGQPLRRARRTEHRRQEPLCNPPGTTKLPVRWRGCWRPPAPNWPESKRA